jgi:hypothetical protein
LKLFQDWGKREIEGSGRGAEFKYDTFDIYFKNSYKCHNVPPPSTTTNKIKSSETFIVGDKWKI